MFNLYDNIKSLCEERGISVSKMCESISISKSTLSNLKNGRSETITPTTARKIAAFLSVSVDDVLHGAKNPRPCYLGARIFKFPMMFLILLFARLTAVCRIRIFVCWRGFVLCQKKSRKQS